MDIVFCCDSNYVKPCGIAIISLLENNKEEDIVLHIIGLDLSEKEKVTIQSIVEKYRKTINFYKIDKDQLEKYGFPLPTNASKHITIAAYVRLFVATLLPESIKRIIYLDCDLIVQDKIIDLWNIDLKDCCVGGVIDHLTYEQRTYDRLGYSSKYLYINSGVLLIDLDFWRMNVVTRKFVEYVRDHKENILLHDQDVINVVLHEKLFICPTKYNVHNSFYQKKFDKKEYGDDIIEARISPTIIHFSSRTKPWHKDSLHPMTKVYLRYKALSPWVDEDLKWSKPKFKYKFRYYKRYIMNYLGLSTYKSVNI